MIGLELVRTLHMARELVAFDAAVSDALAMRSTWGEVEALLQQREATAMDWYRLVRRGHHDYGPDEPPMHG